MNNKNYYVPTIEEFRDGFRYEYKADEFLGILEPTKGKYVKETFTGGGGMDGESEYDDLVSLIDEENVRVKYLDEEDLLELGWDKNKNGKEYNIQLDPDCLDGKGYLYVLELKKQVGVKILVYTEGRPIVEPFSFAWKLPNVQVRNYNEMEVLMRQLSISPSNIKRYDI